MNGLSHRARFRVRAPLLALLTLAAGLSCKNDTTGPINDAGNLVTNSGFELNDKPSYVGWSFSNPADTAVSDDVPLAGGTWSLLMRPEFLPSPYARYYITGENGRRVYSLSVWVKTTNLTEPAHIACGILQPDRTLRNEVQVNILGTDWTQYSLEDTLDIITTDTLVVELSPGTAQAPPIDAQALFDIVRLTRLF
ncbi:hypothetical protein C3F09_07135 [candidate division GN15 bacterium]|uniref:CBM-cenC domain-containing protein n=1 Tax=candidate division GN15 bacterium TaxID=2072418 RepID=A0A855X152_9BACT|nr:MAG: hypothetical protein C3F09_07135 [candidate division GN15 bacterium]